MLVNIVSTVFQQTYLKLTVNSFLQLIDDIHYRMRRHTLIEWGVMAAVSGYLIQVLVDMVITHLL